MESHEALTPAAYAVLFAFGCLGAAGLMALHRGRIPLFGFARFSRAVEPPLWGIYEMVLAFVALFAAQFVTAPLMLPLQKHSETLFIVGLTLASHAVYVVFLFWFVAGPLGQPLSALGFRRMPLRNLGAVFACYLLSFFPLQTCTISWSLLLDLFGVEQALQVPVEQFASAVESKDYVMASALAALGIVVAPFVEELLFRGVLFGGLRRRWGAWGAAAAASMVFASIHFSLTALAPLFVLSLLLCYLYERTDSLWAPIAFHALFNGVSFGLLAFGFGMSS